MQKSKIAAAVTSLLSLAAGLLYYLLFRKSNLFFDLVGVTGFGVEFGNIPDLFQALPTFLHTLSFSMLTWLALGLRYPRFAIMLWAGINLFFELLQGLTPQKSLMLPDPLRFYAMHGTFDLMDIAAIALASVTSYVMMKYILKKEHR